MDLPLPIPGQFEVSPEKGRVSTLLWVPPNPRAVLVLGHGAGAGMTHANMSQIAEALAQQAIATFRYQFPYMERGGGRDSQAVSVLTVAKAAEKAQEALPELPLLAGGHSFGGRMTSHAAADGHLPGVKGLIFFAFPLHAPGKPGNERVTHIAQISQPMLFLSGQRDTFAQRAYLYPVIEDLGARATLYEPETADHGYKVLKRTRTRTDSVFEEMAAVVSNWIKQQDF